MFSQPLGVVTSVPGGAPIGNQNAAKGRIWRDAINRALAKRSRVDAIAEIDRLAELFLDTVEAMTQGTEKRAPSVAGFAELADRLDGRSPQQVQLQGDENNPLVTKVVREVAKTP